MNNTPDTTPSPATEEEIKATVAAVRAKAKPRVLPAGIVNVEVTVQAKVRTAVKLRLQRINAAERTAYGKPVTHLADIARMALTVFDMDPAPEGTPRVRRLTMPGGNSANALRPFRFQMARADYERAKAVVLAAGTSVSAVVQDGMAHFARTGTHPTSYQR